MTIRYENVSRIMWIILLIDKNRISCNIDQNKMMSSLTSSITVMTPRHYCDLGIYASSPKLVKMVESQWSLVTSKTINMYL